MKSWIRLVLLTVAAACGVETAERPADPVADAGDAVEAALIRYYETLSARQWEALRSHFWPGAVLGTVWQPPGVQAPEVTLATIDEFIAMAPSGPGSRSIFEERPISFDVRARGGLAMAWVRYDARFGDVGDLTCWSGTDAFNLLRHDGEWRIVSVAYVADDERGPAGGSGC